MAISRNPKTPKYRRILLKLTGELFGGEKRQGLNFSAISEIAKYVESMRKNFGMELAIVIGAGNIFRGRNVSRGSIDRATADYIGMLGTVINALALQEELERCGAYTRVMSSLPIESVCETFIRRRALRHLEKGRIVILAGGTGNPFFTTDSAAALRACELKCEVILKGSNVEGVFTSDPDKNKRARMYKNLSFQEALEKGLTVMDNTAFALCQREEIPVIVFNVNHLENIERIILGKPIGTLVI